jgi:riboflavin transporter FmnP
MYKKANRVALRGILSGLAFIAMLMEIPFPLAPWLKFDVSETIIVYGTLVGGPIAGVIIALCKSILHFFITGSDSGGVGQVTAFIAGVSFAIPTYYLYKKTRNIIPSLVVGILTFTIIMVTLNYFFITPFYADLYKLDFINQMREKGDGSYAKFIIYTYGLFNLMKGTVVSVIYALIDKYLKRTYKVR